MRLIHDIRRGELTIRAALLLATIQCLLATGLPSPAHATSALFDFDDFPDPQSVTDPDAPATYLYGCDGKAYCTQQEVFDLGVPLTEQITLSATRNGITGSFRKVRSGMVVWPPSSYGVDGKNLHFWDFSGNLWPFYASFDTDLDYVEVDVHGQRYVETEIQYALMLELWSGEDLTGSVVARLIVECAPGTPCSDTLSAQLSGGETFRSMRTGMVPFDDPDCVQSFPEYPCGRGYLSSVDNILVQAIPEPGAATLFAAGLGPALVSLRRKRRASRRRAA